MTDKIDKNLAKFSKKELQVVEEVLQKINQRQFTGLNLVKLKGYSDIFRVRKGRIRIIFQQKDETINILTIERRSKKTYRDF
jgi:mRNA-degrading endonuclease RelE of RelBE toxin-antitoxin system